MALADAAGRHLGDFSLYAGRAGFIAPSAAGQHVGDIASANWHATAALVALRQPDAVLVDIGSTTTDVIPIRDGAVVTRGYSDAERLASGELVYTGVVRTALMAFPERVPFAGRLIPPMPEHFATFADVYRLLGQLPEGLDQHDTADGGAKSMAGSRLRLSRLIGVDVAEAEDEDWRGLAACFAERQMRRMHDGAALALSGTRIPRRAPIIGCGAGRFLMPDLARRLGRDWMDLAELMPVAEGETAAQIAGAASQCAPAAAVALIAAAAVTVG